MNELDRNLAELALLNKSDLPPNPHLTLRKKVGPAVPPKPKKQQPLVRLCSLVSGLLICGGCPLQVPQSYPLKQTVEPSYSSRLQSNQFYSNLPSSNQGLYSNSPNQGGVKFRGGHDNNYANLPRGNEEQFSRSPSALSNASLSRSTTSYGTGYATKNTR